MFFIDVVLPDQSGWCFAKEIREHPNHQLTPIVFITGSQANMSELQRRYHHYDFIEKPYTAQTFQDAVGALLKELDLQKGNGITRPKKKKKVICVEAENGMVTVALDHIFYVEVLQKKMFLHTRTSTIVLQNKRLDALIHEVNDEYFTRCHKSFAVFLKNVLRIVKEDRRLWKVYFTGCPEENSTCLISKTYYETVEKRLKEMREI